MEYATRGHRETQKSKRLVEQVPQSNEMTDEVSLGRGVTWRSDTRTDKARGEGLRLAEE